MAKIQTDVSAVASAWKATVDAVVKFFEGAKGRATKAALIHARKGLKRALSKCPKLREDKTFMKHKESFERSLVRR